MVGDGKSLCLFRLRPWKLTQQQGSARIFDTVHRYNLPDFVFVHRSVFIRGRTCVFAVCLGVSWHACDVCVFV